VSAGRRTPSGPIGAPVLLVPALVAVALLGLAACGLFGGEGDHAPGPLDAQAIDRLTRAFLEAHNEGDSDRLAGLFTDDAVLVPPADPTCEGRDAIADYFDDLFRDAPATAEINVQETRVFGSRAFERFEMTVAETDPDTGEEIETLVRCFWMLERQPDGAWKIARFIGDIEEPVDEEDDAPGGPRDT
jgi:uncharacterized protein (TIGR02246 family)